MRRRSSPIKLAALGAAMWLAAVAGPSGAARAQSADGAAEAPAPPRIDRKLGEEEQIRQRVEWFFENRRQGVESAKDMARLRLAAVLRTRQAIALQQAASAAGSAADANVWVPRGPAPSSFGGWAFGNVAGRVSSIAADWAGGALYLGTASGGLWRSVNDGLSWTQLFDAAGTMTIGTVAVDPTDPSVLWVGTGENNQGCESYFGIGLLRSIDGGATWETRNGTGSASLEEMASFADVIVDARDGSRLVTGGRIRGCSDGAAELGGIYTTADAGATWTARLSGVAVHEIAQDPAVDDVLWAATSEGIYRSQDFGASWIRQTASGLPAASVGRAELAIAPGDGNVVYALFSGGPSLWRTIDGGASWTQMSSGSAACDGQCNYNMVLRVHRTDPAVLYRGTVHLFRSADGGASWTDLSNSWGSNQKVHQDTHALLMHPTEPETFFVGCDGGLWKSTDGGSSFVNRNGNLNITQLYAVGTSAADPETICGGAQDNSSLARVGSDVWELQSVTGDGFVCHFDPQDPDRAYVASYPSGGYPYVLRATRSILGPFGAITTAGNGLPGGERVNWVTPYLLDPTSPNVLYLATQRVYRSVDYGSNWTPTGPADMTGGSGSLRSLELNPGFPDNLYAGSTSGRVWRTADAGQSWTEITAGLPLRSINDLAADPTRTDRAFAVVGGFGTAHLWRWTAGDGWTALDGGLPDVPANTVLLLSANDLLVGNDTGVFRSVDGGASFEPFMIGLPEGLVVTDLKHDAARNLVTAATYGRGAWQVAVGPIGVLLEFDSIEMPPLEIDGDGDANVEPGETWTVTVRLRNAGSSAALDVRARLATATPGVALAQEDLLFGDVEPGTVASAGAAVTLVVDPGFACGGSIVFDLVDLTSTGAAGGHPPIEAAFQIAVLDSREPPTVATPLDEDFDPAPQDGWSHAAVDPGLVGCAGSVWVDDWNLAQKDAARGLSYHAGHGPGAKYSKLSYAWLYHAGRDSTGGVGLTIPADASAASLVLEHWYDTSAGADGGLVVVDAVEDGVDAFVPLTPVGGYPAGALGTGNCNGLEGAEAFHGSSGGWVTSRFDLLAYRGRKIFLAFVFGSDSRPPDREGWYLDRVAVEVWTDGAPLCDVAAWPGSVPPDAFFELIAPGAIEARWAASCNEAALPGQTYSIQVGDLDRLHATGAYDHAPIAGQCGLAPPAAFSPGAGNEYYLVVPNAAGREGGAGAASGGAPRPLSAAACGEPRQATCP